MFNPKVVKSWRDLAGAIALRACGIQFALAIDEGLSVVSADRQLIAAAHRLGLAAKLLAKPSS